MKKFAVWFCSKFYDELSEGRRRIMFFLPTKENYHKRTVDTWYFPIAIVIVLFSIVKHMLLGMWMDLTDFNKLLIRLLKIKK